MITLLVMAAVSIWVVRSEWFVELVAGAALLGIPLALAEGRIDVAATALGLLILSCIRMLRVV